MTDRSEIMLHRRTLLAAVGLGACAPWLASRPAQAVENAKDIFDTMRQAWRVMLTGDQFDVNDPDLAAAVAAQDAEAQEYLGLIDRSADRHRVFVDLALDGEDSSAGSAGLSNTLVRLERLAVVFHTPGSEFESDQDFLTEVLNGLITTNVKLFNVSTDPTFGGWFALEIAAPRALLNTCVLVYEHIVPDDLTQYLAAFDHFVPDPNRRTRNRPLVETGANRANKARNHCLRGILGSDADEVVRGRDALSDVEGGGANSLFSYITSGDGFYADGSFIQHNTVAYTGHYGIDYLNSLAQLLPLLAGSPWDVSANDRQFVADQVDRAFAPTICDGQVMDSVRGRMVGNSITTGHSRGRQAIDSILRLAQGEDVATATRWREMCRGWLERATFGDLYVGQEPPMTAYSIPRVALFKDFLKDETIDPAPEPVGHWMFASMARAVHRRPGWAYAISMACTRVAYYEGTPDNQAAFHLGDGMTYLYNQNNGQFDDGFWPTVDYSRFPGTTVDATPLPQAPHADVRPIPQRATWAGGAVLDCEFAAVGMELEGMRADGELEPLGGFKSWFCLDDAVVALGAGITGGGTEHPVETTVENRNLGAAAVPELIVDGETQPVDNGWTRTGPARWAHLGGVGGYIFPGASQLRMLSEERTGSWSDINRAGTTDPITRHYLTLWFDHGIQPTNAGYAYLLLPNATATQTAQRATDTGVAILANTAQLQAIKVPQLGLVAANFFTAGTIGGIRVDQPCSVVMRNRPDRSVSIAICDPTWGLAAIDVTLAVSQVTSWEADDTIAVNSPGPPVRLSVDSANAHGATHNAVLHR